MLPQTLHRIATLLRFHRLSPLRRAGCLMEVSEMQRERSLDLTQAKTSRKTELKKLTTLTVESSDVSTLTGLETATDLTTLDLSGNAITDISLLSGLTKLTTLDLSGNAITDITALQNLTELTSLRSQWQRYYRYYNIGAISRS